MSNEQSISDDVRSAGEQIRKILMSLHAPGHTNEDESRGTNSYSTDELRKQALDIAGICWKAPGELAPQCGCPPHESDNG